MNLKKTAAIALLAFTVSTGLVACAPAHPIDAPGSFEEEFNVTNYKLDNGQVITCGDKSAGKKRKLACFNALNNPTDTVPIEESGYTLTYYETGDNLLACLKANSYGAFSCVPVPR